MIWEKSSAFCWQWPPDPNTRWYHSQLLMMDNDLANEGSERANPGRRIARLAFLEILRDGRHRQPGKVPARRPSLIGSIRLEV